MLSASDYLIPTLKHLPHLKFLDVSLFNEKADKQMQDTPVVELLDSSDMLPELEFLDVSGWKDLIPVESLVAFLDTHPRLKFVGQFGWCWSISVSSNSVMLSRYGAKFSDV